MTRRRLEGAGKSEEGIMDRNTDWLSDRIDDGELHGAARRRHRRQRPMSRLQEIALLAVAFAIGAGLQIAYILNGAPALP